MTTFPKHTIDSAPESAQPILSASQKAMGFVPNLYANMAEAPAMLEGYTTLSQIFEKSDLSATERQIVLMTNNRLNGCVYCMAAHTWISQASGVPADVIQALREGTPIEDPKLESLRRFSEVIHQTRGWPSETDLSDFLAAGYTHQTVLEVVLGTSLKVLSNYTNHVAETELDSAFESNSWSAQQEVEA